MNWYLLAFKNYATFKGRARRKEYWMYALFQIIFILCYIGLLGTLKDSDSFILKTLVTIFVLYILACIPPTIALAVRRMHDLNKSGTTVLIRFIPAIGGIWYFILTCMEGTVGKNKYGLDPKKPIDELNEIGISMDD
jgi:uncharacterized membrane protein YhaH (DUF805 family)